MQTLVYTQLLKDAAATSEGRKKVWRFVSEYVTYMLYVSYFTFKNCFY